MKDLNEINVKRLIYAGFLTFLTFLVVEWLVERWIGGTLVGDYLTAWHQTLAIPEWEMTNTLLNIFIAVLNSTILMWLYAALRPMFGVGVRTALITSFFVFVFMVAFSINMINLGVFPWEVGLLEDIYLLIELPLAMIVGARFYEAA
jgi:hypothetical protein